MSQSTDPYSKDYVFELPDASQTTEEEEEKNPHTRWFLDPVHDYSQ